MSARSREAVIARLEDWLRGQVEQALAPLRRAGLVSHAPATPPALRAVLAMLVDEGGILPREAVAKPLEALERGQRRVLARLGIRIGALDLFMPAVLKPEAMRWRAALRGGAAGAPMPALPPPDAVVLPSVGNMDAARLGYRIAGPQLVRVDMADRLASAAHEARAAGKAELVDPALITSLGLQPEALARLMRDVGFRAEGRAAPGYGAAARASARRSGPVRPPSPRWRGSSVADLRAAMGADCGSTSSCGSLAS